MDHFSQDLHKNLKALLVDVQLVQVEVSLISIDKTVQQFVEKFNLMGVLKPCSDDAYDDMSTLLLDAYQSPLLVYETSSNQYRLCSGLLTYQKFCKARSSDLNIQYFPCLVLPKRPKPALQKLILLNDFVRPLLKQFVNVSGSSVTQYLTACFMNETQPSVFRSTEWQALFPMIRTKTQLCEWLNISTKALTLK